MNTTRYCKTLVNLVEKYFIFIWYVEKETVN